MWRKSNCQCDVVRRGVCWRALQGDPATVHSNLPDWLPSSRRSTGLRAYRNCGVTWKVLVTGSSLIVTRSSLTWRVLVTGSHLECIE